MIRILLFLVLLSASDAAAQEIVFSDAEDSLVLTNIDYLYDAKREFVACLYGSVTLERVTIERLLLPKIITGNDGEIKVSGDCPKETRTLLGFIHSHTYEDLPVCRFSGPDVEDFLSTNHPYTFVVCKGMNFNSMNRQMAENLRKQITATKPPIRQ